MIPNATQLTIEFGRLVRFGLSGIFATLTYGGISSAIVETGLTRPVAAAVFGYLASATVSYYGHLYFSFRVAPDHRKFFWRFAVTSVITFPMAIVITYLITGVVGGPNGRAVAAVMVLIPLTNYFCNRFWVFLPGLTAKADNMNPNSKMGEWRNDQA